MIRRSLVGVFIVVATLVGTVVVQPASLSAPSLADVLRRDTPATAIQEGAGADNHGVPSHPNGNLTIAPAQDDNEVTTEDGELPDGVSVFDDGYPGVTNLSPDLLQALRRAVTDAEHDGIVFFLTSGWRSPAYQNQLLREAVAEYGSQEEAERWVATAETSAHVSGDAVDLGGMDAIAWLSDFGAEYGLCQIYENEPWHFELRPDAARQGCPPLYADPTQDPRMQHG